MSDPNDWIAAIVTEAAKEQQSLTSSVSSSMEDLLRGQLSEQPLSKKELGIVAKKLIADMKPVSPESKP